MQFSASILDREAPVDAGTIRIAFFLECMDTPPQDSLIRNTPPQTAAAEHAELDFGHVEPASMLGSVVEPQTSGDASGFVRHKSHIQGPKSMGVEVVEDNPDRVGFWIGFVNKPLHLVCKVLSCPPLGDGHVSVTRKGFNEHEQVACSLSSILGVVSLGLAGSCRSGFAHVRQQLSRGLVEAHHGLFGIMRFVVHVQYLLHGSNEVGAHLRNAPLFLLPWLEFVFFRRLRMPSCDMESTRPSSTALSDSSLNVQWSCPSGALLQARAIRCASPFSSSFGGLPGRGRSTTAPCSPTSQKRLLIRHTVPGDTSSASAIRCTVQPSSAFSKIRALATSRAELVPPSDELLQRLPRIICQLDHILLSTHFSTLHMKASSSECTSSYICAKLG